MRRWRIAFLVSAAIAISYLDRQTLPVAVKAIQADIPISNEANAALNSRFLITYGLMYLVGGWMIDRLGTRRGFGLTMGFWSLACMSHGLARNLGMLGTSRLLLGAGEGGGFPAATRAVAEWFPVKERATAMGIINAGTGVGGVVAPPFIAWVLLHAHWFDQAPWRWVFFLTGTLGLLWLVWWFASYFTPSQSVDATGTESQPGDLQSQGPEGVQKIPLTKLLSFPETWAVMTAKFLTDAAWYFYLFWLPKYLYDARGFDIKGVGSVAWIPPAAAGIGCLCGGGLSSWLLARGVTVDRARKIALGASAAVMPCVMLVPHVTVPWVIFCFSLAFFGQQSWSTLVMILPTDLFPRRALGTVAGLVGLGGAMGGVVLGQLAGYLLDHGVSYGPILIIAGSLHVIAFFIIIAVIRRIKPLQFAPQTNS